MVKSLSSGESGIDKAAECLDALDAAGYAIVVLRCDRETDIRRVVAKYVHAEPKNYVRINGTKSCDAGCQPVGNMMEVTACGTLKGFFDPFSYYEHMPSRGQDLDLTSETSVFRWLEDSCNDLKHRLLYVPDAFDLIGKKGQRSELQTQYLYLFRALAEGKRRAVSNAFVVIGCTDGQLCGELLEYAYVLDINYPSREEVGAIFEEICRECGGARCNLEPSVTDAMADVLRGMRRDDIRNVVNVAYAQCENPLIDGAESLFKSAREAKKQRVAGVRGLSWYGTQETVKVGGLDNIIDWLDVRGAGFRHPHAAKVCKVSPPKGILVAGLPGCGKTLLAKRASLVLSCGKDNKTGAGGRNTMPLLKLDLGAVLDKYVGKSEANFSNVLSVVNGIAPCVLLVDEIEKAFGGVADGDGGSAGKHILAALLDWMQEEHEKPVLVIATANKTDRLPPELLRKGRFDEVFFTGIPTRAECEGIFVIHMENKKDALRKDFDYKDVSKRFFDLAADERRFMNGADIESIINGAFCRLLADRVKSGNDILLEKVESGNESEIVDFDKYSPELVMRALEDELRKTRTFFNNNMESCAAYWVKMQELNFRNASDTDLLDREKYDPDTGRFSDIGSGCDSDYRNAVKERAARAKKYDDAFRCALAVRIFDYVQKRKQGKTGGDQ